MIDSGSRDLKEKEGVTLSRPTLSILLSQKKKKTAYFGCVKRREGGMNGRFLGRIMKSVWGSLKSGRGGLETPLSLMTLQARLAREGQVKREVPNLKKRRDNERPA